MARYLLSPLSYDCFHPQRARIGSAKVYAVKEIALGGGVMAHPVPSDQEFSKTKHMESLKRVRSILLSQVNNQREALTTIDSLKRLCIDYYFSEEISAIIDSLYRNLGKTSAAQNCDLFEQTLSFRLLRQAGYYVSSTDMLGNFIDEKGEFKSSLSKDIRGMLSLHEASYLNTGEEILYKAQEFSGKHLKSSINLEPNLARLITQALEHPYHMSLQQYKARHHLCYRQKLLGGNGVIEELAVMDFIQNEQLYLKELKEVTNWWRRFSLSQNIKFSHNQVSKWYMWSMTILQGPHSKYRVEMAKVVAFVYIIDDIYDVVGSLDELPLFTEAINKWEHPSNNSLPDYMGICYAALYDTINEIANISIKEHGWNPINSLKRAWAEICNANMVEAKWFAAKHIPTTNDYLKNSIITTGVHIVGVHSFFLLGHEITNETVNFIESCPAIISSCATILRFWDDLGSAEDENEDGYDGSYVECYTKEHPECSVDDARAHVKGLISKTWQTLNKECFSSRSLSQYFIESILNCARMVKVMYSYDEQRLPLLEEYTNMFLRKEIK